MYNRPKLVEGEHISRATLYALNSCTEGKERFGQLFPEGAPLTLNTIKTYLNSGLAERAMLVADVDITLYRILSAYSIELAHSFDSIATELFKEYLFWQTEGAEFAIDKLWKAFVEHVEVGRSYGAE